MQAAFLFKGCQGPGPGFLRKQVQAGSIARPFAHKVGARTFGSNLALSRPPREWRTSCGTLCNGRDYLAGPHATQYHVDQTGLYGKGLL